MSPMSNQCTHTCTRAVVITTHTQTPQSPRLQSQRARACPRAYSRPMQYTASERATCNPARHCGGWEDDGEHPSLTTRRCSQQRRRHAPRLLRKRHQAPKCVHATVGLHSQATRQRRSNQRPHGAARHQDIPWRKWCVVPVQLEVTSRTAAAISICTSRTANAIRYESCEL